MKNSGSDEIPVRPDGLQLDESRPFQRGVWFTQRIVWLICAGIVAIALAGGTGRGGPYATQSAAASAGEASLPRIARRGAVDVVTANFTADAPDHRLGLSADFLARFEVETITPHPVAEVATEDGTLLLFSAMGLPPHQVRLSVRARLAGMGHPVLTLDGQALRFTTLTLP